MTSMQPARIAGEMIREGEIESESGVWRVNAHSGRYSRDYATAGTYLGNAVRKIASFFSQDRFVLSPVSTTGSVASAAQAVAEPSLSVSAV